MLKFQLFLFGFLFLFKLINNLIEYIRCKHYLNKYYDFMSKEITWEFEELVPQIKELFKNAGIQDASFPHAQLAGCNQVFTGAASVLSNITHPRIEIRFSVIQMFHRAIGVYRSRILDTINPLYWIRLIVYLPKRLLSYVGVSPDRILVKVSQVVYWGLTFIYVIFETEINQFLKDFIRSVGSP